MSATTKKNWLEKLESQREARYRKRVAQTSRWLPRWRNQACRRKLVIAFEVSLLLLLLSGIVLIAALTDALPRPFAIAWAIMTLILMVAWSSLNITVDMIDSAPIALLDEYQQDQILSLRGLTYRCYTYFGMLSSLALILVGVSVMDDKPDWGHYVPYSFGIFGIVAFLFISTLPTVIYAWNLRDE